MASLSSSFLTSEAASFCGNALPKGFSSAPSRVTMGYSRQDLEKKPLSLLKTLARQQGVALTSKAGIIDGLLKKGQYSYSPDLSFSAPPSTYSSSSSSGSEYSSMTLGELRALARTRGVRGDTKAELIKALLTAPPPAAAPAAVAPAVSSSNGAAASSGLPREVLVRKSLAELRALARSRGIRGDTKAELVNLLAGPAHAHVAPSPVALSSFVDGAMPTPTNQVILRQLATKSMSQLRAIANIKGIRGTTKDELVRQLAHVL